MLRSHRSAWIAGSLAVIRLLWPPEVESGTARTAEEQAEVAAHASRAGEAPRPAPAPLPDPRASLATVLFFSDFEGDDGGLSGTRDWQWGTYAWVGGAECTGTPREPPGAYSGSRLWGTVLNTCYSPLGNNSGFATCSNANLADDSILSFTVDLTLETDATLSWLEWFDLFTEFDWAEVRVNGAVVLPYCRTGYTAPTAWVVQAVDLTPFVGGMATIDFHMMASAVVEYAGWYIDDVKVESASTSCSGVVIAPTLLLVKGPATTVVINTPGPTSTCATGIQVRMAATARPAVGGGSFPTDPLFVDVTSEDLDAGPDFRHVMPPGDAYYRVVEALPGGLPGPSGSYGY